MLRKQLLDDIRSALDLCLIELRLHRKPYALLLECVENIGRTNRFKTSVLDPADHRFFGYVKYDNFASWPVRTVDYFRSNIRQKPELRSSVKPRSTASAL